MSRPPAVLLSAALLLAAARGHAADAPPDWIEEREGALELKLAHEEKGRPDGGILRIDPNHRVVLWEGIPGGLGCRQSLQAPFADVKAVRVSPEAGFTLELRGRSPARMVFMPLPHAPWLARSRRTSEGVGLGLRDALMGPDGNTLPLGGSATFAGPQLRELPREVVADVRLAVDRIREALGRQPSAGATLYEALYGQPADVSLEELLAEPSAYAGRAVRLRGAVEPASGGYRLVEEGASLPINPSPEMAALVQARVPN